MILLGTFRNCDNCRYEGGNHLKKMPSLKIAPLPEEAQEVGQSWNADLDNDDEFGEYFDGYASYGESLSTPPAETEVAVIGNGPSAICLSYFLSGNWPFYNGQIHPNEILQWHLSGWARNMEGKPFLTKIDFFLISKPRAGN